MRKFLSVSFITFFCLLAVTACGRKGLLEPAPGDLIEDSSGKMVEKPKADKPFFLDRLIK